MPAAKVKKPKPKSKKELQAELEAHYAQLKVVLALCNVKLCCIWIGNSFF